MDFGKLYEGIFLRDLLEYLVPGIVFLGAMAVLTESLDYNYYYSVLQDTKSTDFPSTLIFMLSAYVTGHLITGFNTMVMRKHEDEFNIESFEPKQPAQDYPSHDKWFINQIETTTSRFLNVPVNEAKEILRNKNSFKSLREICRLYVQHQLPTPYREFVLRHSVFSRFFQNMFVALGMLTFSLIVNFLVSYHRQSEAYLRCDYPSAGIYLMLLALLGGALCVCWKRPADLRKKMMIHTFQIWHSHLTQLSEQAIQGSVPQSPANSLGVQQSTTAAQR